MNHLQSFASARPRPPLLEEASPGRYGRRFAAGEEPSNLGWLWKRLFFNKAAMHLPGPFWGLARRNAIPL